MHIMLLRRANMVKKIIVFIITLSVVISLGTEAADAGVKDDWDIHYYSNAPSYISKSFDNLEVTYYGLGFVAKATSLTGSYDRHISIQGRDGTSITGGNILITASGMLTSSFMTTGGNPTSKFEVNGYGNTSCVSTGWIYINDPSVYNS
jgi:hypothetical protein